MRRALAFLTIALFWSGAAFAQPVTVIGPVTPGNLAAFNSPTVIKDSGSSPSTIPLTVGSTPITGGTTNCLLFDVSNVLQCSSSPPGTYTWTGDQYFKSGRPWVDIRAYGAVGDGVTDDYPAIQNAVNGAEALPNGGSVFIPAGNYCIKSGTVTLNNSDTQLQGGGAAILSACGVDNTLVKLTNGAQRVSRLTLFGKGYPGDTSTYAIPTQPVIWMAGGCGNNCSLDEIVALGGNHVVLVQATTAQGNNLLTRSTLNSSYGSILQVANGSVWLSLDTFDNVWPVSVPGIGATANAWASGTVYTSGTVVFSQGYYIQCVTGGTSGGSAPTLKFYGNLITDNTATWKLAAPVGVGAVVMDTAAFELYAYNIDTTGANDFGIQLANNGSGTVPTAFRCVSCIGGQTVKDTYRFGAGNSVYISNTILGVGFTSGAGAINFTGTFTGNATITGGEIAGSGSFGILVNTGAEYTVSGVNITAATDGVFIGSTASNVVVTGNTLSSASSLTNGVLTATGADYYTISNNQCSSVVSTCINDAAAGTHSNVSGNGTKVLQASNNLSDVASASTSRTNLGVTATGADTTYNFRANNLSDVASASTARTNLGLGALATVTPGTGVATALAVNVGTAGSPVVNGGALGTPSSGTLTNATGLPVAGGGTGLSSGTSGGIPYFNTTSTMLSSGALTSTEVMLGGGAGGSPTTLSGCTGANSSLFCTTALSGFPQFNFTNSTNDANTMAFILNKNRSGGNTLSADTLADFQIYGFANSAKQITGRLFWSQAAASSGSNVPSTLKLQTSDASGLLDHTLTYDNTGNMFIPDMTATSAAQTGTVCWTTGTGKLTVDTTVGCLTSLMAAKNITEHLSSAKALEIVSKLDPFSFRYKPWYGDGGQYEQFGLGAEEVALVDERLVGRDSEGTLSGVRYQEMSAVLAGAIQQLKSDNDSLRACQQNWKCRIFGMTP